MTQSNKQLSLLTSPLNKIQEAAESTFELLKKISEVILSGGNSRSGDSTSDELRIQTHLLIDIKNILRYQNRILSRGGIGAKGGPGRGMFTPMGAKNIGLTALMIVGIAGAIVGAAAIFSFVPAVSGMQLLTVLAIVGVFLLITPVFIRIANVLSRNSRGIANTRGALNPSNRKSLFALAGATALSMIGIAISIVISGAVFSLMPTISGGQLLTALAISVIMILAAFAFTMILKSIRFAKTKQIIFAALAMPIIALGIVLAAVAFMLLPSKLNAPDPIWTLKAALAIGLFAVGFYFIMKAIRRASTKELIFGGLAMPILALGVVVAAYIFMALPEGDNLMAPDPIWTLKAALAIGLFAIGFIFIMKAIDNRSFKDILFGMLAIPIIAIGVVLVAYIFMALPEGDNLMAPDPLWTLKAGLSMALFGIGFYFILLAVKGATPKEMLFASVAIPIIAIGIVLTAYIFMALPEGDNVMAPDLMWTLKAGLAMALFGIGFYFILKAVKGATPKEMLFMVFAIPIIAFGILATAWIFQVLPTKYNSPDLMWTLKAAASMIVFGAMILAIKYTIGLLGTEDMPKALLGLAVCALAVLAVAWIFSYLPSDMKSPSLDWIESTAIAMTVFGGAIVAVGFIIKNAGGPVPLLYGALGVVVIAIVVLAVGWILSLLEPAMPALKAVAQGFTDMLLMPINGIVTVFARFKNEIGIENMISLAIGVAALGYAWLIFSAAVAGGSVAGILGSAAGAVGAIFDGISSLFNSETPSPLDILRELSEIGPKLKGLAKPLIDIGVGFAAINKSAGGVTKAFQSVVDMVGNTDADDLAADAKSISSIAGSYTKIATASKALNIKAITATTDMFKALTDLAKNKGESAMGVLADKLLKAVKELTGATLNLEQSVKKQEENNKKAVDGLSGAIENQAKVIEKSTAVTTAGTAKTTEASKETSVKLSEVAKALRDLTVNVHIASIDDDAATKMKTG